MNFRYFLIVPLFISLTITCKSNKNSTKSNEAAINKIEITENDSTSRFIVSFYSIGSGTESEQMNKLKEFISAFGKERNKDIRYNETSWGREGEIDFCFTLIELSESDQKDLISGAKIALKEGKWIHFFENQQCRKQE